MIAGSCEEIQKIIDALVVVCCAVYEKINGSI